METKSIIESEQLIKDHYEPEYDGQNIEKLPSFKKWYKNRLREIKIENKRRSEINVMRYDYHNRPDIRLLCIFYYRNCKTYTTCYYDGEISCRKCGKCKKKFCPGCNYILPERHILAGDTACLKGYWILWWLRTKNCRSDLVESRLLYYIMQLILCIFFTPLYLGFLTFFFGYYRHRKTYNSDDKAFYQEFDWVYIYSILFGLLMFPYITIFMLIMILVLIPGIFNHDYYIYIFIAYVTTFYSGSSVIKKYY